MLASKQIGKTLAKISIGVLLIGWLIQSGILNVNVLLDEDTNQLRISFWYLAILLKPLSLILLAYRWRRLLQIKDINLSFPASFRLTTVAHLFMIVFPGMIATDIARAYGLIKKINTRRSDIISVSIVDRILGIYALFIISTVSSIIFLLFKNSLFVTTEYKSQMMVIIMLPISIFLIMNSIPILIKRTAIRELLDKLGRILKKDYYLKLKSSFSFDIDSKSIIILLLVSLANHLINIVLVVSVAQAVSDHLHPITQFILSSIGMAGNLIPLTPGGFGITEGVFAYLFLLVGSDNGAVISLISRILSYSVFIALGFPMWVLARSKVSANISDVD